MRSRIAQAFLFPAVGRLALLRGGSFGRLGVPLVDGA